MYRYVIHILSTIVHNKIYTLNIDFPHIGWILEYCSSCRSTIHSTTSPTCFWKYQHALYVAHRLYGQYCWVCVSNCRTNALHHYSHYGSTFTPPSVKYIIVQGYCSTGYYNYTYDVCLSLHNNNEVTLRVINCYIVIQKQAVVRVCNAVESD